MAVEKQALAPFSPTELRGLQHTAPRLPLSIRGLSIFLPYVRITPIETDYPFTHAPLMSPSVIENIVKFNQVRAPKDALSPIQVPEPELKQLSGPKTDHKSSSVSRKKAQKELNPWRNLGELCAAYIFGSQDPEVRDRMESLTGHDFLLADTRGLTEHQAYVLVEFGEKLEQMRSCPGEFKEKFEICRQNYQRFYYLQKQRGYNLEFSERSFVYQLKPRAFDGNPYTQAFRRKYERYVYQLYKDPAITNQVLTQLELTQASSDYDIPHYLNDDETKDAKDIYADVRPDEFWVRGSEDAPQGMLWDHKLTINADSVDTKLQMIYGLMGIWRHYALAKYAPVPEDMSGLFGLLSGQMKGLSFIPNLPPIEAQNFNERAYLELVKSRLHRVVYTATQADFWLATARVRGYYRVKPPKDRFAEHAKALGVSVDTPRLIVTKKLYDQEYEMEEVDYYGKRALNKFDNYWTTSDLGNVSNIDLSSLPTGLQEPRFVDHFYKFREEDRPKNRSKKNQPKTQFEVFH